MAKIQHGDVPTSEELDGIVERLSEGNPWSTDGLRCDNFEVRMNELYQTGALWWSITDAISGLRTLKEYGRLENIGGEF